MPNTQSSVQHHLLHILPTPRSPPLLDRCSLQLCRHGHCRFLFIADSRAAPHSPDLQESSCLPALHMSAGAGSGPQGRLQGHPPDNQNPRPYIPNMQLCPKAAHVCRGWT